MIPPSPNKSRNSVMRFTSTHGHVDWATRNGEHYRRVGRTMKRHLYGSGEEPHKPPKKRTAGLASWAASTVPSWYSAIGL